MKKLLVLTVAALLSLSAGAQIAPQAVATFQTKNCIATDPAIRLQYTEELNSFVLQCSQVDPHSYRYTYNYIPVNLGETVEQAIASIDALIGCIESGKKGQVFDLGDGMIAKVDKMKTLQIIKEGYLDPALVGKIHLENAKAMLLKLK